MASQKTLELYVYVDGVNDVPFYGVSYEEYVLSNGETYETPDGFILNVKSTSEQIKIGSFRYDAKRMGGAPTITFSLMYEDCLDNLWSDLVYAKFRGEKYFLKQTPTSSKSNDDARYKHDVELVAERTILDNAYFYDAVIGSPLENDVPVTNSTKFNFYGDIETFVRRMNASLQYTGIQKVDEGGHVISGYHVVLDDDVVTRDQKQVSFDSAVFSQALQEAYNTFGIPFYFDGQTIHVGYSNNIIDDVLEYGVDGALLSATKTNANFKVVNRATGEGSSENIPYYYPNNSAKGELYIDEGDAQLLPEIVDYDLFAEKVDIDVPIEFRGSSATVEKVTNVLMQSIVSGSYSHIIGMSYRGSTSNFKMHIRSYTNETTTIRIAPLIELWKHPTGDYSVSEPATSKVNLSFSLAGKKHVALDVSSSGEVFDIEVPRGMSVAEISVTIYPDYNSSLNTFSGSLGLEWVLDVNEGWYYNDTKVDLEDLGISLGYPEDARNGDTLTQRLHEKVPTSDTLQPSIYRATHGKERFYNAINYPFRYTSGYELKYGEYLKNGEVHNDVYKKDDGTYYEFTNEYKEGRPREHVFTVDDIKPTIKEMTNSISWVEQDDEGNNKAVFQRIDMFSEFAYNIGDSDETYVDPNGNTSFKHPYFFGKLRKLDFNLFEHASEMGEMTFSMTSGNCGACNFKIGVSEDYPQFNTVQVYEEDTWENGVFHAEGSLKYDENGYVLCGLEDFQEDVQWQERQQDTKNYEVWIALKKEEDTYGILMPKAPVDGVGGHRPVACSSENANDGDTFVILNINLPDEYIYKAEKKLEKAIVKYIWENNVEKFNFSVNFSRIFLEENPDVLNALNENARLTRVKYNGDEYILYVSSYSYSMNEGDVLPEIRIELDDTLTISQNALQNAVDGVKSDMVEAINAIDVAALGSRYFLRKDVDDVAEGAIDFKGGISFGNGGSVSYLEDGSAKMSIDFLEVKKKATFTSLEIQEQSHVGGQILISPASMVCSDVEELDDVYRCYFETTGEGGEEIFNQFAVGDQAISQTFNAWGGHYYWRLVTEVGENYIDLSKEDCASGSDAPSAGDKIIQLGNRSDQTRQAAQVLSAYGENSPSFIMYNGIDSYSLEGKNITGIVWNDSTGEPRLYSYGDFFFGDRKLEGNYITFQQKKGDAEKSLHINADITIGANSSGLTNLSEWGSVEERLEEATNGVTLVQQDVQNLQDQIDGVVENHFYAGVPTVDNFPAVQWTTDAEKANHVGDTYINIATEEQDPDNAGKAWRWAFTDNEHTGYHWHPIADTDAVKALLEAYKAQAGIDDLQYLKDTFAKSVDVEGVVMSEMMAVKDGKGNIEAFLNGSGFAEDTDVNPHTNKPCGKLILAAGIPNDDRILEERAKEATTRIYEDGCTYTKNLHLQDGCTVGDLNITDGGGSRGRIYCGENEWFDNIENPNEVQYAGLSKNGVRTIGYSRNGKTQSVHLENDCAGRAMLITVGANWGYCRGGIDVPDAGLEINAPNAYGICMTAGVFAGLRPNTRTISTSETLTKEDHTILCNTSGIIIYLPVPAQKGQMYRFLRPNARGRIMQEDWANMIVISARGELFEAAQLPDGQDWSGRIVEAYWNEDENRYWVYCFHDTRTYVVK